MSSAFGIIDEKTLQLHYIFFIHQVALARRQCERWSLKFAMAFKDPARPIPNQTERNCKVVRKAYCESL